MADTALSPTRSLDRNVAEPSTIEVSPNVVDALIAVGGAVLFAVAGVLLGAYLMLPFDLG